MGEVIVAGRYLKATSLFLKVSKSNENYFLGTY
jgi:hypothetical protein